MLIELIARLVQPAAHRPPPEPDSKRYTNEQPTVQSRIHGHGHPTALDCARTHLGVRNKKHKASSETGKSAGRQSVHANHVLAYARSASYASICIHQILSTHQGSCVYPYILSVLIVCHPYTSPISHNFYAICSCDCCSLVTAGLVAIWLAARIDATAYSLRRKWVDWQGERIRYGDSHRSPDRDVVLVIERTLQLGAQHSCCLLACPFHSHRQRS